MSSRMWQCRTLDTFPPILLPYCFPKGHPSLLSCASAHEHARPRTARWQPLEQWANCVGQLLAQWANRGRPMVKSRTAYGQHGRKQDGPVVSRKAHVRPMVIPLATVGRTANRVGQPWEQSAAFSRAGRPMFIQVPGEGQLWFRCGSTMGQRI